MVGDVEPIRLEPLEADPLVSVIVANYNYGRYLAEMVDSVVGQTYGNWELLICDDGSTDDSRSILDRLAQRDPRIRVFHKPNGGQASAWNLAFAHARGSVISFLDADDWFSPRKVEAVVAAFRRNSAAGLVYHQLQITDEFRQPWGLPLPSRMPSGWLGTVALKQCGYVFQATTSLLAVRREVAERLFPVPEVFRRGSGDAYLGHTAAFITEIAVIPGVLGYYRRHGRNYTAARGVLDAAAMRTKIGEILAVLRQQDRFLRTTFGPELASRVRFGDMQPLWEQMGAVYVLEGRPRLIAGYSPADILENLSSSQRRRIWKLLFALPPALARRLLALWWGKGRWKGYVRPVGRLFGLNRQWTG